MDKKISKEVFDKYYEIYRNLERNPAIPVEARGMIYVAMSEYAYIMAIGFADWASENGYEMLFGCKAWEKAGNENQLSTEQLYDKYISETLK